MTLASNDPNRAIMSAGRWLAFALISASICLSVAPAEANERESFRVCADPHYLPWSNDQLEGIENRIAALLAKQLGQTVEYTWFPQRMGFIRNTLRSQDESGAYPCDVVMGLPAGFELALTSEPYYHSTYALVYIAGRGLDSVDSPEDLLELDAERRSKLRFGLAERNPGTLWLAKYGMLDRLTVAYASQQGDPNVRPGQFEQADLLEGTIDATFMWGPIAGHFLLANPDVPIRIIPVASEPDLRMHFGIALGVRFGDRTRLEKLQALLDENQSAIEAILLEHAVPLVDSDGIPL